MAEEESLFVMRYRSTAVRWLWYVISETGGAWISWYSVADNSNDKTPSVI